MATAVKPPSYYTLKTQVPLTGGQTLGFAKGKGYYAAPGSKLAAAASGAAPAVSMDPYSALLPSALTPAQIQAQVSKSIGGYPAPMTAAQIQAQAAGEISPLVQAVTNAITGQTKAASDAITGYTHSLQNGLASTDFAAPYTQAEQGQAAVDSALQQSLNGAGQADVADLGKRLGVINDPAVAAAQAAVGQNATANAGTQVAQGSNALADLIANAAAASSYGQKLGGVAGLYGVQQLAQNAANGQAQIGSQTQQLESQVPSIIQALQSESDQNATNRASAGTQLFTNLLSSSDSNATNRAQLAEDWAKNQGAMAGNIALAEGKDAAQVQAAAIKAEQAAQTAATKASAPSPSLSRANGYLTDNSGQPKYDAHGHLRPIAGYKLVVGPDGSQSVVSTKATKTAEVSPSSYANLKKQALAKADLFYYGQQPVTNTQGIVTKQGIPGIDYTTALRELVRGYSLKPADAKAILNTFYQPGERGRPLPNAPGGNKAVAALDATGWPYNPLPGLFP